MLSLAAFAAALLLAAAAPAQERAATATQRSAAQPPRILVVILPEGVGVGAVANIPGAAAALMSGGIGNVPPSQTYLDITQGTRTNPSLYPEAPPVSLVDPVRGIPKGKWRLVLERAAAVPAPLVPGLLASRLHEAGVPARAVPGSGNAGVIAADQRGRLDFGECLSCPGLTVTTGNVNVATQLARGLRPGDLLIAFERPPADRSDQLALAIAGLGEGVLRSRSTRKDGYVLATDLAPTILDHLGLEVPAEMSGVPLEVRPGLDVGELERFATRMAAVPERRSGAVHGNFFAWLAAAGLAWLIWRRRGLRFVLPLVALATAYLPTVLLLCAALEPSAAVERAAAGLLPLALAALTRWALRGWAAFALAAGVSVGAQALDVIAGSPLTSLSLLGPNPSLGVRFYGIGNELESTLTALLMLGTGAALAALPRQPSPRAAAVTFALAAVLGVAAFAPGRFGADVGAAIAIPAGAAFAIVSVLRLSRSRALLVLALPLAALALLVAVDLITGGGAHFSRSVLEAGGLEELGQVAERRLRLCAQSFVRFADSPVLWAALLLLVLGFARRRRVLGWFSSPYSRAGFLGALGATLVGTLANDSGATIFMMGTAITSLGAAYAWALSGRA